MSKKWTDSLPSLLEGYEEAAPEGLWDAVQAGLAPKNRVAAGWWYAAGGLLAAAAVTLAVFLWKPRAEVPVSVVPGDALVQADGTTPSADDPVAPVPDLAPDPAPRILPATRGPISVAPRQEVPRHAQNEPETQPSCSQGAPTNTESAQNAPAAQPAAQSAVQPAANPAANPTANPAANPAAEQFGTVVPLSRKKKAGRVEVQFSSGAYLAQARTSSSGFGISSNPGIPQGLTKASSDVNVYMLSRNRASETEATHRQNIRLSLGVSYEFVPRWSVGTGLTYTSLRSDYNITSGESSTNTVRHLYYLGVPITLQWRAFEWNSLSINVNTGPLFEWAVSTRVNTQTYIGNHLTSQQQESHDVKDPRWSLFAGVGVQYQLFRYGALFLQPGVSWHIPTDSGVESFYSAHPFSIDFTFGYRFTF